MVAQRTIVGLGGVFLGGAVMLAASGGQRIDRTPISPPVIGARAKSVLNVRGTLFKDSNGNGALDLYEDWRLPVDDRVNDLVARMTLEEKAGLMLIDTLNADCGGAVSQAGVDFINKQQMSHFIFQESSDRNAGLR